MEYFLKPTITYVATVRVFEMVVSPESVLKQKLLTK